MLRFLALIGATTLFATQASSEDWLSENFAPVEAQDEFADLELSDEELNQLSLAEALVDPDAAIPDEELERLALAEAFQPPRPPQSRRRGTPATRRRSARRRRSAPTNPLAARVARLEKEVKFLRAWLEKLAGGGGQKPHVVACKEKDEGDSCEFSPWPGKEPLKGKCMLSDKVMWCKVDKPPSTSPPQPPSSRRRSSRRRPAPPEVPPHVVACKDKAEGDKCQFTPPRGIRPISGKCASAEKDDKKILWCKPEPGGGKPPGEHPVVKACKDKEEGDKCTVSYRPGMPGREGKCKLSEKGDEEVLWCETKGGPGKPPPGGGKPPGGEHPLVKACKDKEEGDKCEVSFRPGMPGREGKCKLSEKGDEEVLWCETKGGPGKPPPGGGKPPGGEHPLVKACKDKEEGDKCEVSFRPGMPGREGKCKLSEKGDEEVLWCETKGGPGKPPPGGGKPPGGEHPLVKACKDKAEGDTCEVSFQPGMPGREGKCKLSDKGDKDILWCDAKGGGSGGPGRPPSPVAVCKDKEEGDECEFAPPGREPRKGLCHLTEKDGKKILWCKIGDRPERPEGRRRKGGSGRSGKGKGGDD